MGIGIKALVSGQRALVDFSQAVVACLTRQRIVAGPGISASEGESGTLTGVDMGAIRTELGLGAGQNAVPSGVGALRAGGDVAGEIGENSDLTVAGLQKVPIDPDAKNPEPNAVMQFLSGMWRAVGLADLGVLPDPGTEGNVLTSTGDTWISAPPGEGGGGLPGGGTDGQYLKKVGDTPTWADGPTGTLPDGDDGQFLGHVDGAPAFVNLPTGVEGGALPAVGSEGDVLTTIGGEWQAAPPGDVGGTADPPPPDGATFDPGTDTKQWVKLKICTPEGYKFLWAVGYLTDS